MVYTIIYHDWTCKRNIVIDFIYQRTSWKPDFFYSDRWHTQKLIKKHGFSILLYDLESFMLNKQHMV